MIEVRGSRFVPDGELRGSVEVAPSSRERTMALKALHRLGKTDLLGLGVGLDAVDEAAVAVGLELGSMRDAVEKESAARRTRGLVGPGPYERAYHSARAVVAACALAVERTELPQGVVVS